MPAITRQGDTCTGHDDCPPSSLVGCESNVLIDGKPVGVVGSTYAPHGCDVHDPHSDVIASGSSTVFVNGKPVGRVGDAVSIGGTVASGSPTVTVDSLGPDDIVNFVKCTNNYIDNVNNLSEVDEVIFALPQIAKMEALRDCDNEDDKIGWLELSKMLAKWLGNKGYTLNPSDIYSGNIPIFTLSMNLDWFMSYPVFSTSYHVFKLDALSYNGQQELIKNLQKLKEWGTGGNFDFTVHEPKDWEKYYFNYIVVKQSGQPSETFPFVKEDGMSACLATHSIRALAKGTIKICDNGDREIIVSELYFYVHDLFQFEGDEYIGLRYWSKKHLDFSFFQPNDNIKEDYIFLNNHDFRNFRDKFNIGHDFLVLSKLFRCKEYVPEVFKFHQ